MHKSLTDEEIALKIVEIYFEEIVRSGTKRKINFDSLINSYFYVLEKINNKDEMLTSLKEQVEIEEENLLEQSKEEIIPSIEALKEKIPEKTE